MFIINSVNNKYKQSLKFFYRSWYTAITSILKNGTKIAFMVNKFKKMQDNMKIIFTATVIFFTILNSSTFAQDEKILNYGINQYRKGNYVEAYESFSIITNYSSVNFKSLFFKGITTNTLRKTKEAESIYDALREDYPDSANTYYLGSLLFLSKNNIERSKQNLRKYKKLTDENIYDYHLIRAYYSIIDGNFRKAKNSLKKRPYYGGQKRIIDLKKNIIKLAEFGIKNDISLRTNKYELAVKKMAHTVLERNAAQNFGDIIDNSTTKDSIFANCYLNIGKIEILYNNLEKADSIFSKMASYSVHVTMRAKINFNEARISYKKENFDETINYLKKAISLNPQNEDYLKSLAETYYYNEEDEEEACRFYKRAHSALDKKSRKRESIENDILFKCHQDLIMDIIDDINDEDFEDAKNNLSKIENMYVNFEFAHHFKRIVYWETDNYEKYYKETKELMEYVNKHSDEYISYVRNLGYCNYQFGKIKEADKNLSYVLDKEPTNVEALIGMGYINLLKKEDTTQAVKYFQKAIEWIHNKSYEEIQTKRYLKSLVTFIKGDYKKAQEQIQQFEMPEKLVVTDEDQINYNFNLFTKIYNLRNKISQAIDKEESREISKVLKENSSIQEYFNAGIRLYHRRKYETAIKAFNQIIEKNENHGGAYYYRALTKLKLNPDDPQICIDLKKAAENDLPQAKSAISKLCK